MKEIKLNDKVISKIETHKLIRNQIEIHTISDKKILISLEQAYKKLSNLKKELAHLDERIANKDNPSNENYLGNMPADRKVEFERHLGECRLEVEAQVKDLENTLK